MSEEPVETISICSPCPHEILNFGSGGYYVFCHACGAIWDPSGKDQGDSCDRPGNMQRCMTNVCQIGPGETGYRVRK